VDPQDSDREEAETEKKYQEINNTWGDGIGDLIKQFNSTGQLVRDPSARHIYGHTITSAWKHSMHGNA
jgi:hypothetical protein